MSGDVKAWLGSQEGRDLVRRVAVSMLHEVSHRGLVPPRLEATDCRNMSRDELLDECRAEISLFLVERLDLVERILTVPGPSSGALLRTAVIHAWRTRLRTPRRDPFRYLYKRASDVLRSEGRTVSAPAGVPGVWYAYLPESRIIGPLTGNDLRAIPFPDQAIGRRTPEAVGSRSALLTLAEHFCHGISGLWNGVPVRIAVRDLVRWIAVHVPLTPPGETIPLEEVALPGVPSCIPFDPEQVRQWAGQCSGLLTPNQGKAFFLYEAEGLGLEDIARTLGYRSASGAKYALDRARAAIRFFLRDLPWVSPDDLNEEAFSIFREELLAELKNRRRDP